MNKQELRQHSRQILSKIDTQSWQSKSQSIVNQIVACDQYIISKNILIYNPLKDEININLLLEHNSIHEKTIYYPPDNYNDIRSWNIDLAIIPALGYSKNNYRLGRGMGYFDRVLANSPNIYSIGIVPIDVVYPTIPIDNWDQPLDIIITA